MATTRATKRPSRTSKRTPVDGNRDILTVDGIPEGYVGRWVNDVDDRLQRFQDAGYEFLDAKGTKVGDKTVDGSGEESNESVISRNVGKGRVSYLMVQKEEWYDEDQQAKQTSVDEREAGIKSQAGMGEGLSGNVKIDKL